LCRLFLISKLDSCKTKVYLHGQRLERVILLESITIQTQHAKIKNRVPICCLASSAKAAVEEFYDICANSAIFYFHAIITKRALWYFDLRTQTSNVASGILQILM